MKKILSVLMVLSLTLVFIGLSSKNTVQATYGGLNTTLEIENLYYNGVLDETSISTGDVLYGSGYNEDFSDIFTVGKNLFDIDTYVEESGGRMELVLPNTLKSLNIGSGVSSYGTISLSNDVYTFSATLIDGSNFRLQIVRQDNLNTVVDSGYISSSYTFTLNEDTNNYYIKVFSQNNNESIKDIQIEVGSSVTTYEYFKINDDLYVNRFGIDYNNVIKNSINWGSFFELTNTMAFRIDKLSVLNYKVPIDNSVIADVSLTINNINFTKTTVNSSGLVGVDTESIGISSDNFFWVRIDKSKLTGITSTDFETYLQANDVLFVYELEDYIQRNYAYTYIEYINGDELPYLYNLTDIFGSGNEPTRSEFETILSEAPDYFETYQFNYFIQNDSIIEVTGRYNVDNLIENGDFSDVGNNIWSGGSYIQPASDNYLIWSGNVGTSYATLTTTTITQKANHQYYLSLSLFGRPQTHALLTYNGISYDTLVNTLPLYIDQSWETYSYIYQQSGISYQTLYRLYNADLGEAIKGYADNFLLFDLSSYYGLGNEPTKEQFESLVDTSTYASTYTYEDDMYVTVDQGGRKYQYYSEDSTGLASFRLEDSLIGLEAIDPYVIIKKYDLDMNYISDIYEGYITDHQDQDGDGKLEHRFDYNLPEPVTSESGYIWVAYGKSDESVIYDGGYLMKDPSDTFLTNYTTDTNRNNITDKNFGIAVNDSIYNEYTDEVLYKPIEYNDYILNASNNQFILHFQTDISYFSASGNVLPIVTFYNENNGNEYDYTFTYENDPFISNQLISTTPQGFRYFSIDDSLPSLFQFFHY